MEILKCMKVTVSPQSAAKHIVALVRRKKLQFAGASAFGAYYTKPPNSAYQ